MARKSRKQIQVVAHIPTELPMTVGYARLSVNDRVKSHSIENQKKIIALWAEQQELPILSLIHISSVSRKISRLRKSTVKPVFIFTPISGNVLSNL